MLLKAKPTSLTSLSVSGSILSSSSMDPRATTTSSVFLVPLKLPADFLGEHYQYHTSTWRNQIARELVLKKFCLWAQRNADLRSWSPLMAQQDTYDYPYAPPKATPKQVRLEFMERNPQVYVPHDSTVLIVVPVLSLKLDQYLLIVQLGLQLASYLYDT